MRMNDDLRFYDWFSKLLSFSKTGLAQEINSPPVILYVSAKNGLPETEVTWAKLLQNQGYSTQAVGK